MKTDTSRPIFVWFLLLYFIFILQIYLKILNKELTSVLSLDMLKPPLPIIEPAT